MVHAVASRGTGERATIVELLRQTAEGPLSGSAFFGLLAAIGLAALFTLIDLFWPWPQGPPGPSFAPLVNASNREALEEVRSRVEECTQLGREQIAATVDELLRGAIQLRASDIHLSPSSRGVTITYRMDGSLHEVCRLATYLGPQLATRIKVLARLDTYTRKPQDGKLRQHVGADLIEARVSTLPVDQGERVVLRITRGSVGVPQLSELGFLPATHHGIESILARPQGLFLVSGPVGSGKTTTLYSALQHVNESRNRESSLVTLEDPIELQLPFATQTQINPAVDMNFAQTLRSVLRQDPNVLMLGEIRDRETASIAAQAGLSGHLILSTLHVDRAVGSFPRLMDMGVEPFVLASTVVGALSQRLVRTLCTHCRKPAEASDLLKQRLAQLEVELPDGDYADPTGCEYCEGRGFTGRTPIAELLVVNDAMRKAVSDQLPSEELHRIAVEAGMIPLLSAGLARARTGETSLSEVFRVVG